MSVAANEIGSLRTERVCNAGTKLLLADCRDWCSFIAEWCGEF